VEAGVAQSEFTIVLFPGADSPLTVTRVRLQIGMNELVAFDYFSFHFFFTSLFSEV
jgi:hypothetical protein